VTAVTQPVPVVIDSKRRFPAVVEGELERRRSELLSLAWGEVLDLDRPAARAEVARAAAGQRVESRYDSAVCVAQLLRFPDLVAALRGIDRLVGPTGRLLLVEPAGRPGPLAVVLDSVWARTPWVKGFHLGRDITAGVRATTFSIDDIERFTMSTSVMPLRHAVEVHAVRSPARAAPALSAELSA
jgi:hypothetical protein